MIINILLFGIVRDILKTQKITVDLNSKTTIAGLKEYLFKTYPELRNYSNFSVAVNEEYIEDSYRLQPNDIVALIPPVSGG